MGKIRQNGGMSEIWLDFGPKSNQLITCGCASISLLSWAAGLSFLGPRSLSCIFHFPQA